jgi:IclR family acetate operon transcriptional repressor
MRMIGSSLARAVDVIELLAEYPEGERLSAIAQRLELPKSAVHRLLAPLCVRGWAEQDASTGRYMLSLRFAALGRRLFDATGLHDACQPVLDRLARESRELVRLTLAQDGGLGWLCSAQGAPPGLRYEPAMTGPVALHATANGKAWLATLPDAEVRRVLRARGMAALTARTIVEPAALLRDLALVRRRGWALADEEAEPGVAAIAVAVGGAARGGKALGTLSVAGPVVRMPPVRRREIAAALVRAAADLRDCWPRAAAVPLADSA